MQFLVVFSLAATTAVCPPPAQQPGPPGEYIRTFVNALTLAHESAIRTQPRAVNETWQAKTQAFIELLKMRQRDYECIASQMTAYKRSDSQSIRSSADTTAFVFNGLRDLTAKNIQAQEQYLEGKVDFTRMMALMAEGGEAADELWKTLPTATLAATNALIEAGADGRATGRLTITESQRYELHATLRKTFGFRIERGVQKGQPPLLASAAALYQFLGSAETPR